MHTLGMMFLGAAVGVACVRVFGLGATLFAVIGLLLLHYAGGF